MSEIYVAPIENEIHALRKLGANVNIDLVKEKDSIELGTPSKGGALKIYLDFNDVASCQKKIMNALEIQQFAQAQIGVKFKDGADK